jgi:TrmH family RNA methyltransferase
MPIEHDLQLEGLTLVLDGIGDPGNIGTLVRSADAVGAGNVITTTNSADAYSPKAVRASAGSVLHLPPQSSTQESLLDAITTRTFLW